MYNYFCFSSIFKLIEWNSRSFIIIVDCRTKRIALLLFLNWVRQKKIPKKGEKSQLRQHRYGLNTILEYNHNLKKSLLDRKNEEKHTQNKRFPPISQRYTTIMTQVYTASNQTQNDNSNHNQ